MASDVSTHANLNRKNARSKASSNVISQNKSRPKSVTLKSSCEFLKTKSSPIKTQIAISLRMS